MKNYIFILTAALMAVAVMAVPAEALDLTFYVHAWDNSQQGQMPALQVDLWIVFRDGDNQVVEEDMFNPGGGGLYWEYIPDWLLLGLGAETWEVQWRGNDNWDLVVPDDPEQSQGDINWNGNNPADPQDWWFNPVP